MPTLTLVQILREAEKLPNFFQVNDQIKNGIAIPEILEKYIRGLQGGIIDRTVVIDRTAVYHQVLEEYRRRFPMIDRTIKGETTILQELEMFYERVSGLLPKYPNDKILKIAHDLNEIIGSEHVSLPANKGKILYENPVSSLMPALIVSGGVMSLSKRPTADDLFSRRILLQRVLIAATAIGGFSAGLIYLSRQFHLHDAKENALYVQSKIEEVYGKVNKIA